MENVQGGDRPVERLIRIGEVKRLTGISTATLYRKISTREFPRPVQLGVVRTSLATVRGSELDRWTDRTEGRHQ